MKAWTNQAGWEGSGALWSQMFAGWSRMLEAFATAPGAHVVAMDETAVRKLSQALAERSAVGAAGANTDEPVVLYTEAGLGEAELALLDAVRDALEDAGRTPGYLQEEGLLHLVHAPGQGLLVMVGRTGPHDVVTRAVVATGGGILEAVETGEVDGGGAAGGTAAGAAVGTGGGAGGVRLVSSASDADETGTSLAAGVDELVRTHALLDRTQREADDVALLARVRGIDQHLALGILLLGALRREGTDAERGW